MEQEFITSLVQQGGFAGLFVWLLFNTMKQNSEREAKLHELLSEFAKKYDIITGKLDDIEKAIKDKEE